MKAPRFEIVGNYQKGFHARYIAGNGEIVWWTENYARYDGAEHAVRLIRRGAASAPLYNLSTARRRLAG